MPRVEVPSVLRYGLVAGGCLIAHNAILIAADRAGFSLFGAAAWSFCIMVVAGYLALARLAFREPATWRGFSRYGVIMVANFPLSVIILWLANAALDHRMELAAPAATTATAGLNFLLSRWAITNRRRASPVGPGSCAS